VPPKTALLLTCPEPVEGSRKKMRISRREISQATFHSVTIFPGPVGHPTGGSNLGRRASCGNSHFVGAVWSRMIVLFAMESHQVSNAHPF
jgi:hypothetical protein